MEKMTLLVLLSLLITPAYSEMHKEKITYSHQDTQLTGYLFWDDAFAGERPGIMVFHEWWGLNDYALLRAEMLAESGYVAFAADMYGNDKVTRHAGDAKGWMLQITNNIDVWQQRAKLGLAQLKAHAKVDMNSIAVIGYCFGGATAMQLAYSGADLDAVISVHGSLPPASASQAEAIQSRVLVLHGGSDNFIPKQRIKKFITALDEANVDWEMDIYGGARHSFSNPYADGYGIDGVEFNELAEQRSWNRGLAFLKEVFHSAQP
jgi:dienelactone hydrolase